jgi:glycosyltransferase involved in cell wall biosynthesis
LKVAILSTYDNLWGAARATYRLHQAFRQSGIDSTMIVGYKSTDDFTVQASQSAIAKARARLAPILDALPETVYTRRNRSDFSVQWLPDQVIYNPLKASFDIIHVHWICDGFLRIETLAKLKAPIVLTLHDMWTFTGGCHYSGECKRYTESCGKCPQLASNQSLDLSRWIWQRKATAWKELNITLVSPSKWLADCARCSSLFKHLRVETIPNGIDTTRFKPLDKHLARNILNLPQEKKLITFGAANAISSPRKGFHLLQESLLKLSETRWADSVELLVFGQSQPEDEIKLGFKTHYLGIVHDEVTLSLVYACSDIFVAPSIQDNLPNTVVEALACGIPCVAFDIGGLSDLIHHYKNGYLAQPFSTDDLCKGIVWVIEDSERHHSLSIYAARKAEEKFDYPQITEQYKKLFNNVLNGSKG